MLREGFLPLVADHDDIFAVWVSNFVVSLAAGMGKDLLTLSCADGVEDIEELFLVQLPAVCDPTWKVDAGVCSSAELGVQSFHAHLRPVRPGNPLDLFVAQQLLLACENLLGELHSELAIRWSVSFCSKGG